MDGFLLDWRIQQTFLEGLLTTLRLSAAATALAIPLGFLSAFARMAQWPWLRGLSGLYVAFFRNTPLLIQLYLYYRGLQSIGINLEPDCCGVLALTLYSGAYFSEIFRSGLLAIPSQQREAGLSLGFNLFDVYRLILIPQAIRLILPALCNQVISLTKNSSLVAFITVSDLFLVVYKGAVDEFKPVEAFLEGATLYLLVSLGISAVMKWLENRLALPEQSNSRPEATSENAKAASYG